MYFTFIVDSVLTPVNTMYFTFMVDSILTPVNINCSAFIHNIEALIKQDVGIPPSLLSSIRHPNKDNE